MKHDNEVYVKVPAFSAEEWNAAIEKSQNEDLQNDFDAITSFSDLTLFEKVVSISLLALLSPIIVPAHFIVVYFDKKRDAKLSKK